MGCKQKRMVPGVVYLQYRMRKSGACAGEGLGGREACGGRFFRKGLPGGAGAVAGWAQLAGWVQMSERIFPAAGYGFTSVRKSENIPPPKRNSPARAPGIPYLQYRMRKSGACAGEGLGGGSPRGTGLSEEASPGGAGTAAG